jgi:hypothetical protein
MKRKNAGPSAAAVEQAEMLKFQADVDAVDKSPTATRAEAHRLAVLVGAKARQLQLSFPTIAKDYYAMIEVLYLCFLNARWTTGKDWDEVSELWKWTDLAWKDHRNYSRLSMPAGREKAPKNGGVKVPPTGGPK